MVIVVEKMRSSLSSVVRRITSSRQSPRRSALRAGFDLVLLLAVQPSAVKRRWVVSVSQSHFETVLLFNLKATVERDS